MIDLDQNSMAANEMKLPGMFAPTEKLMGNLVGTKVQLVLPESIHQS
jgi:hypothetical protein